MRRPLPSSPGGLRGRRAFWAPYLETASLLPATLRGGAKVSYLGLLLPILPPPPPPGRRRLTHQVEFNSHRQLHQQQHRARDRPRSAHGSSAAAVWRPLCFWLLRARLRRPLGETGTLATTSPSLTFLGQRALGNI